MDPKESNLDYDENINFIDLENQKELKIDARQIKSQYNKAFKNFCDYYKNECVKNNIDYIPINTMYLLDGSLMQYLIKRMSLK